MREIKPRAKPHPWQFRSKFRAHALGWRGSATAVERLWQAVAEIRSAAKTDPKRGADGAVTLIERISPAFDQIDGSSGALGAAIDSVVAEMSALIAAAPLEEKVRQAFLERLWRAFVDDEMPFIECLGDHWGEICAERGLASRWADRIEASIRQELSDPDNRYGFAKGFDAYYSSLLFAAEYDRLMRSIDARPHPSWSSRQWGFKALVAQGKRAEALRYAEATKTPLHDEPMRALACEELLLGSGLADEAYARYAMTALNRDGTNLATFKRLAKKYPLRDPRSLLADLIDSTPGREGKWFATAKELKLYDEALALVERSPADPKTLMRAATKHAQDQPAFAYSASVAALRWLAEGYGYEITVYEATDMIRAGLAIARECGKHDDFLAHATACCGSRRIFWKSVRAALGPPFADDGR